MIEYEEKLPEINDLLGQMRPKWQLDSLQWIDYDDVCQHIRRHIWLQWEKWDQSRPFVPWCRQTINNQILNIIRNNYGSFARPCLSCKHNTGGDGCDLTKTEVQDQSCSDYAKWRKKRYYKYNIKITLPIENRVITNATDLHDTFDYEKSAERLHQLVLDSLTNDRQRLIYRRLYIEGKSDKEVAEEMGFTPDNNKKGARYKQISNLKKKFVNIAKQVLDTNDIIG